MTRTILLENNLPTYFWVEAINTACHILNRFNLRQGIKKTPFELILAKSLTCHILEHLVVTVSF